MNFRMQKVSAQILCTTMLAGLAALSAAESASKTSLLWGEKGELWVEGGRLPDFSYAGYRSGEAQIPNFPVTASVLDFGATPDDDSDDTEAFQKAVEATESGAILIPAGRYILTDRVSIRRSNVALRGEGTGKTILYFPKGLEHIDPKPTTNSGGRPLSGYSWSDGFLGLRGSLNEGVLTSITAPAERGARRLTVEKTDGIAAGTDIMVSLRDDAEKTLFNYLYADDPGNTSNVQASRHRAQHIVRVVAIEGNDLIIDRPLRYEVRPEWSPQIRRFEVSVSDSGIENLTVEFPARTYEGHFTEQGYNAVMLSNVRDCWVRNIEIINSDSGVHSGAWFCTFENFTFRITPDMKGTRGDYGHHGMSIQRTDNLVTGFDFQHKFIHDLTVTQSAGNVFANGRGVDLCFDHHKRGPHSNLYTNIDVGKGTNPWRSGGGANIGRHAGAWTTFWSITSEQPIKRQAGWSPDLINLVGIHTEEKTIRDPKGLWLEATPPDAITPRNLYEAQLQRRLAKKDSPAE